MADGAAMGSASGLEPVFGIPNPEVNAWGITKREGGRWTRCTYPDAKGVHHREWPLSDLSTAIVRDRWDAGTYRVAWFVHDPENEDPGQRHRGGGSGQVFTIDPQNVPRVTVPEPSPQPASNPAVDAFGLAREFMRMTDDRVNGQLQSIATLATAIAGGRGGGGVDAAMLQLLLDKQQMQFSSLVERMGAQHQAEVTQLRGEIATLRSELGDEDDEDEGETREAVSNAAKSIVRMKRGDSFWDTVKMGLGSYFLEDPGRAATQAVQLASAIPGAIDALNKAMAQQQAPQTPQPTAERPRAQVTVLRPQPQQAPTPPPVVSGLNEALTDITKKPQSDAAGE